MDFEWDEEAEASYFTLSEEHVARTRNVSDSINVDLDADGNVVGVEFLGPIPLLTEHWRVEIGVDEETAAEMRRRLGQPSNEERLGEYMATVPTFDEDDEIRFERQTREQGVPAAELLASLEQMRRGEGIREPLADPDPS